MNDMLYFSMSKAWFEYINQCMKIYNTIMAIDNNNKYKSLYVEGDRCSEGR